MKTKKPIPSSVKIARSVPVKINKPTTDFLCSPFTFESATKKAIQQTATTVMSVPEK